MDSKQLRITAAGHHLRVRHSFRELTPADQAAIQAAWSAVVAQCREIKRRPRAPVLRLIHGKQWRGSAWRDSMLCRVTICDQKQYPCHNRYPDFYLRLMPGYTLLDRSELLASFVAHELWHLYTPYHHTDYLMEFDCEAMACRVIRSMRMARFGLVTLPDSNHNITLS